MKTILTVVVLSALLLVAACDDSEEWDFAACYDACIEKGTDDALCRKYCGGDKTGDLSTYSTFEHGGVTRHFLYYAPPDLPLDAPLVIYLHGYGGYADEARGRIGLDDVADANGFAVCYAQGSPALDGLPSWNPLVEDSTADDVGFLSALAQSLQSEHGLDPMKTYAAGFSAGGFMTYVLAMAAPDVFKGAASFAGHMSGTSWDSRESSAATFPLLQISGLDDAQVPIEGGTDPKDGWGGAPHMDTIIDYWKDKNMCATSEVDDLDADTTRDRHIDCTDGNEIWYYKLDNFGHLWPTADSGTSFEGAELIWDFFGRF